MSFLLFLLIGAFCLVAVLTRWSQRRNVVVPLVMAVVNLPPGLAPILMLVSSFRAVAHVNEAEKANVLAAGISEAMRISSWLAVVQLASAVIAFFVDRAVLRATDVNRPGT